jgi:hypothetical protein
VKKLIGFFSENIFEEIQNVKELGCTYTNPVRQTQKSHTDKQHVNL